MNLDQKYSLQAKQLDRPNKKTPMRNSDIFSMLHPINCIPLRQTDAFKFLITRNATHEAADWTSQLHLSTVTVSKRYRTLPFRMLQSHTPKTLDKVYESVSKADLIIFQPVKPYFTSNRNFSSEAFSSQKLLEYRKPNAICISIPSIWFYGHHVDFDGFCNKEGDRILNFWMNYPKHLIRLFNQTNSFAECANHTQVLLDPHFLSSEYIKEVSEAGLAELKKRELELEDQYSQAFQCRISDFLKDNLNQVLYFTPGHPSFYVLNHVLSQILNRLELPSNTLRSNIELTNMQAELAPILPSISNFFQQ